MDLFVELVVEGAAEYRKETLVAGVDRSLYISIFILHSSTAMATGGLGTLTVGTHQSTRAT